MCFSNTAQKAVTEIINTIASPKIDDVVDAYEHAVLGYYPRGRYIPGANGKYLFWPMTKMPEWLTDLLYTKNGTMPLPACCTRSYLPYVTYVPL